MAIRVGRWDCKTCGTNGILGPETKCSNCGSPRPENVQFYLPEDAPEVSDEAKIKEAHAGADWVCSHCGSHSKHWEKSCSSCGSPKDVAGDGDEHLKEKVTYFDYKRQQAHLQGQSRAPLPKKKSGLGRYIFGAVALLVGFILLSMISSDYEAQVLEHRWERKIAMEEYKKVIEEDWNIPQGGQRIKSFRAVHHYNQRLVGHETRTKRVQTGTERYKCGTRNKGNGYFEDVYCSRPVYGTKEVSEPVYEQIPVYQTKYQYSIMRWKPAEPLVANSTGKNVYWPETPKHQQNKRFRQGDREESYYLIIRDHHGENQEELVPFSFWNDVPEGGKVKAEKSTVFGYYKGLKEG